MAHIEAKKVVRLIVLTKVSNLIRKEQQEFEENNVKHIQDLNWIVSPVIRLVFTKHCAYGFVEILLYFYS